MIAPTTGTIVFGRYVLRRELARGCMGSVWIGLDKRLQREVAVKLMQRNMVDHHEARSRFEREAMAVAQLRSPHIVQIFDYGIDHEIPFIVMELLEGDDLKARLKRLKTLSLEQTSQLVAQAAKGLAAAHAASIIHRDLKPANLFLVRSGDEELLKLLDFGVAKADDMRDDEEEVTKVGMVLGTPQYMSPEQARGMADIDHRADLWSLGVIAFRCLTGRLPFSGKNVTEVIVAMLTQCAPPATSFAPHLPVEIDEFFGRALAPNPANRFASAREMATALAAISPVSFPSLSMPEPPPEVSALAGQPLPHSAPTDAGVGAGGLFDAELTPPSFPSSAGLSSSVADSFPSGAQWLATPGPELLTTTESSAQDSSAGIPAPQSTATPRRSRAGIKLAALAFVALSLGAGLAFVTFDRDKPAMANAASPTAEATEAPSVEEIQPPVAVDEAAPSASEEAPLADPAPSASATAEEVAEAEPSAQPVAKKTSGPRPKSATGGKPRPPATAKKPATKPKPPKTDPDPFSERL